MTRERDIAAGARNLVEQSAELEPGESVLIVHEDPALGWYDAGVVAAVADEVRGLGIEPEMMPVGAPDVASSTRVFDAVGAHDCTLFLSRLGDQNRFDKLPPGTRAVMCYVRDTAMLASAFGRTANAAFLELKTVVNDILFGATRIEIDCPLGSRVSGSPLPDVDVDSGDVSTRRFPVGVPRPMEAARFSGRVALAHFLTPTGSRVYEPSSLELDDTIFAEFERGRIVDFSGPPALVARVREHYRRVASAFGIDADAVDSWHAGIHPGSVYAEPAARNPDRWSNTAFTNPRFVHFHTCGNYPPGEICWMVLDPSISIDGVYLWQRGRLRPENFAVGRSCLERWPELVELLAHPCDEVGLPAQRR